MDTHTRITHNMAINGHYLVDHLEGGMVVVSGEGL